MYGTYTQQSRIFSSALNVFVLPEANWILLLGRLAISFVSV